MKDTQFAFADAKVRALESTLLTPGDIEQMISASTEEITEMLRAKGWDTAVPMPTMFQNESRRAFEEIKELLSQPALLAPLTLPDDFHNLKAALRGMVTDTDPMPFYLPNTVLALESLQETLQNKQYEFLPPMLRRPAQQGYEILVQTGDAQAMDLYLDRTMLHTMQSTAHDSGSRLLEAYAQLFTALCDIKTAYRAAKVGKDYDFLERALCGSEELDSAVLADAAQRGTNELLSMLMQSRFAEAAEKLKISMSAFEKWGDDALIELVQSAKLTSFGPDPLIAYYFARQTEIKTVRIVLICKSSGASERMIRERIRELYV